jgi:hypothetical protein
MTTERHPLQQCVHFVRGLRSQPWWNASEFPLVSMLEENSPLIREEYFNLLLSGRLKLHPQSHGGPMRKQITNGDWNIFELCSRGRLNRRNAVEAPLTAKLLNSIPEIITNPSGLGYFSVLHPNVHIAAHCGPTNTRIRIHLGLRVPDNVAMRVGKETKKWEEGKCLVFDDSWEHEVFNRSDCFRAVLLVDMWHPDITFQQRRSIIQNQKMPNEVRLREREGWSRNEDLNSFSGEGVECTLPMISGICKALSHDRIESIRASAVKVQQSDDSFVAAASEFTLGVLRSEPEDKPNATAGFDSHAGGMDVWPSLVRIFQRKTEYGLEGADFRNLVHICSLYWRSNICNSRTMLEFLDQWEASEKVSILSQLCRVPTEAGKASFLARYRQNGILPFGATAALAVVSLQQMLARQSD